MGNFQNKAGVFWTFQNGTNKCLVFEIRHKFPKSLSNQDFRPRYYHSVSCFSLFFPKKIPRLPFRAFQPTIEGGAFNVPIILSYPK